MSDSGSQFERVLVVEDHAGHRKALASALTALGLEVRTAACVAAAREELDGFSPDLLVLDVDLPDGSAVDVMQAARERALFPAAIAMSGAATPEQSFALAQLGVQLYLPKPIDLAQLEEAVALVARTAPDLEPHVRASVGHRPIHELEEEVRKTMLKEAIARSGGNRRGAARLLQVSRQLVQQMLRRHEID